MPIEPTTALEEFAPQPSLLDRIAELEARVALLAIQVNVMNGKDRDEGVRISAGDAIGGLALAVLTFGGMFVLWGLS